MKKRIILLSCILTIINMQATVQPIRPGENICKLIARIGTTADAIESCLSVDCDKAITQNDIPFTITAPGVYCLAENVEVLNVADKGITIESECVTLNLCGHTIEGGWSGIHIDGNKIGTASPANVTVQNGLIKNTVFEGVYINNTPGPVELRNIHATGCLTGVGVYFCCDILIQDCESSKNNANGFDEYWSQYCSFKNCVAINNAENGFRIFKSEFSCFIDCQSEANAENIVIANGSDNVLFECVAKGATNEGFLIKTCGTDHSMRNVFYHCAATNNGKSGFSVGTSSPCGKKNDQNTFSKCIASSNGGSGFELYCDYNQIMGCSSLDNGGLGIKNEGTDNFIQNNLAHDNTSGNYSGVSAVETSVDETTGFWANVSE